MSALDTFEAFGAGCNGVEWLCERIDELTEQVEHLSPVEFSEKHRYFPRGTSPKPGYMDFETTPYWIDLLNCLDPYDPCRELTVMKGVKTSFSTTAVESGILYLAAHLRAYRGLFFTADKELSQSRMKTDIIPTFNSAGFANIFQSSDSESFGKTGKTRDLLEWLGGGSLIPGGAKNADKLRQHIGLYLWLDEMDAYPQLIGRDGDPIGLIKSRCTPFWPRRKIIMGSTPLIKGSSHVEKQFKRGNQMEYHCRCLKCGYDGMWLKWSHPDLTNPDVKRGMVWDYKSDETYDKNSIRYECWNCGHGHTEQDKEAFINKDNSFWKPYAEPAEEGIVSAHMPMQLSRLSPWDLCVSMWHDAFARNGKVKNTSSLQLFYNNVLGTTFEIVGEKIPFRAASGHRRTFYAKGQIPNTHIIQYCASHIMLVGMTVDVGDHYLDVAVWGFTVGGNNWLIDYKHMSDESEQGCNVIESHCWVEVQRMIDEQEYIADDGKIYWIENTFIDAGDGEKDALLSDFCSQWDYGVYPIKGDSYSSKRIMSFRDFTTAAGVNGYMIAVDHYKDRLAPVLRRHWQPEFGDQGRWHFNAPVDISDDELKELTAEFKREYQQKNGTTTRKWYRPKGSRNELWDLLVYANCLLEVVAHNTCKGNLQLDDLDWPKFWDACESETAPLFYRLEDKKSK